MGSSISVVIAELCRGVKHRNKIMQAPPCMPIMWRRYVDDCLAILRYGQVQCFPKSYQWHRCNIQFKVETEKINVLPFLDILIYGSNNTQ